MTQHEKIYEMVKHGGWVCQHEFWAVSHSPHKRRAEMSRSKINDYIPKHAKYNIDHFEERECTHGIDRAKDYKIVSYRLVSEPREEAFSSFSPPPKDYSINGIAPRKVEKETKQAKLI